MFCSQLPGGTSDAWLHDERLGGSIEVRLLEEAEGGNDGLGHCAGVD